MSERLPAFANRAARIAPPGAIDYTTQINNMIHHFDYLAVVEVRPGPTDCDLFPAQIEVEDRHKDVLPTTEDEAALNDALMANAGPPNAPSNSAVGVRVGADRAVRRGSGE